MTRNIQCLGPVRFLNVLGISSEYCSNVRRFEDLGSKVNKFNQFDGELDYTKRLIGEDVTSIRSFEDQPQTFQGFLRMSLHAYF